MTAGFYSPLPPARTGVADYSAALIAELRKSGEVWENAPGEVNLYHLGNNRLHAEIYHRALAQPGVIVLHDAVLNHFLLGTLGPEAYRDEFVYNYGAWHAALAERLYRERARSAADPRYFRYPMLKRAVTTARAVIVHNPAAAEMAREHGARRVYLIPHLFVQPALAPDYEILRLRASLGVGVRTFLFGVFGHLRESKRLHSVLRAFHRLRADAALLIAGDCVSTDLARGIEPLLAHPRMVRVPHTSEVDFWRYAAAVDSCINLRYPQAGETSGIAIRLMGIGKPVLLTSGDETSAFPETVCVRVDAGPAEIDMLTEYMGWLAARPADARGVGQRAAVYIAARHGAARCAAEYWRALEECA